MGIKVAILTISDRSSQGQRIDESGPLLRNAVQQQGWLVCEEEIVPDQEIEIQKRLVSWADSGDIHLILTTGGTGFSPRDVTPEVTKTILDREAPGLVEAMRAESLKVTPHAMLSRAIAGMRGNTIIINLPGSPKGALENFQVIIPVLPHAVQLLQGDSKAESGHQLFHTSQSD